MKLRYRSLSLALVLATSLITLACGDDQAADDGGAGGGGSSSYEEPVYLIQTAIYGSDGITLNYVVVSHELDFNIDAKRLASARYTGIEAIQGAVFAADGAEPFIRKYEINDELEWETVGELNFGAYPMDEWNYMNFYFQSIKDEETAYFYYGTDKTSRVVWTFDDFKIVGDHQDTKIPQPASGFSLNNGGNRTGMRDYAGPVVQPFSQSDEKTYVATDTSWLAVYDEKTHVEKDVIEVPCPGIQQTTQDEEGNLYFSTTYQMPTAALYGVAPAPCIVRVNANGTLDESFEPNDLTEFTGGLYGVNFRYMKDGKAVANILHHDRIEDADFDGDVQDDIATRISEDPTLWELHVIDLETGTSEIVTGFKEKDDLGHYTTFMEADGRFFTIVQLDTDTTRSGIYELDLDTATVTFAGESEGDIWGVSRLR